MGKITVDAQESSSPEERAEFRTTDLSHAAALRSYGVKLIRLQEKEDGFRSNRRTKTEFVFPKFSKEHDKAVPDILVDFSNNNLPVDAKTLLDNYRNLKATSFGKGMKR